MAKNQLMRNGQVAGKALAEALSANTTLKELDLSGNPEGSSNEDGPGFAKDFAVGLGANGALVKFDISENALCAAGTKAVAEALKGNQIMTELNISSICAGMKAGGADMSGVIAISDAIPTMGALTSLNISKNDLGGYWKDGYQILEMTGINALAAAIPDCK